MKEIRVNNRAAKYFGKYYGVNWDYINNPLFWEYPLHK
jgi:hypothetical protein